MCTTMASFFFLWESLCREGLDSLCTSFPFSSLLSWLLTAELQLWSTWQEHVWNWAPKQMPSCSHSRVKANSALCDGILLCFSSRPLKLSDDQHPTPFGKWLHCHRISLRHGILDITKEPTKHRTSCTQESANDVRAVGRVSDQPGLPGTSVQDE